MPCRFVDENCLAQWIGGTLDSKGRSELAQHLDSDCPDCEEEIAKIGPDHFGNILSARAEALAPSVPVPTADEERVAFQRVMDGSSMRQGGGADWVRWLPKGLRIPIFAAAATAMVFLLIMVGRFVFPNLDQASGNLGRTLKGTPGALELNVHLWFDVATLQDGQPKLTTRGEDGGTYKNSDFLVLRFWLETAAFVLIVRTGPDGKSETVYRSSTTEPAGTTTLKVAGLESALPLQGLSGSQHFHAVASSRPLSENQVESGDLGPEVTTSEFSIEVQ